ncbi:B-box zinc finger protein 24-like [Wolffia australiana]
MKIQCDVCEKATATVICCADEAALCAKCDLEIHAANKLASKHQRLRLDCLPNKLPRCDICQEKMAFIFCVEDRALFCRDCDESIHVPGTLSGGHQRLLATGIRVALTSSCNTKNTSDQTIPEPTPTRFAPPQKTPNGHQTSSSLSPSAWAVDDFLQLSDYESSDKKDSPGEFGELDWFSDIGFFPHQVPRAAVSAAAEVPQLPVPGHGATHRPAKPAPFKKQRIEALDVDDYFTVPDLG